MRLEDNVQDFIWYNREILSAHIEIYIKLESYDKMLLINQDVLELKYFTETLLYPENIEMLNFSKEKSMKDTMFQKKNISNLPKT